MSIFLNCHVRGHRVHQVPSLTHSLTHSLMSPLLCGREPPTCCLWLGAEGTFAPPPGSRGVCPKMARDLAPGATVPAGSVRGTRALQKRRAKFPRRQGHGTCPGRGSGWGPD